MLGGAVVLLVGGGGTAFAHSNYVRSTPAADARLAKAPAEVRIAFSEPPDQRGSAIAVLDTGGARVDLGDLRPSGDENGLRVSLRPVDDGGYLVAWTSVSTVDGHETKGSFAFAVGDAPLPAIPDLPNASPPPSPLEIAGRALSFGGVALALGLVLFGALVREPRTPGERGREGRLLTLGGAMLALGAALLVVDQGDRLPPRLGLLLATRALAGLAVAGAQLGGPAGTLLPPAARRLLSYAAGLGAALTLTLVSHAAAEGSPKAMLLDLTHLIAVSAWLGGLAGMLVVILPEPALTEADARALGTVVKRFSTLALTAVGVLIASGSLAALDRLVLVEDLWETPYGISLALKIVLLAAVLGLAALNLLRWGPRLRRGLETRRAALLLRRGVLGEAALLAIVLVAAAFLTAFAPPASRSAGYAQTRHVTGLRIELLVPSPSPGRNRFVLRVHEGLTPVTKAEKVALVFTMIEHDMGESELVTVERAPGEYVVEGSPTAMFGNWRAEAIVRRTGREDVRTVFTVPITAPIGGGGVTARAIPAGANTAVVFLDPALPTAGAPFGLNIILVDPRGDPVPGRTPTLTLQGPAIALPLGATVGGPGRYIFAVAGLDAGIWQVTVALGDAAFSYDFEVAR